MGTGTFFFAHGAGNREADAAAYAAQLRDGLGLSAAPDRLRHSRWGVESGPDPAFPRMDDVLPPALPGLAVEVEPAAEDSLRPLAMLAGPVGLDVGVEAAKPDDIAWLVASLEAGTVDLSDLGISPASLRTAAEEVAASPEFAAAGGGDAELFDAVLTSIVARAIEIETAAAPPELQGFSLEDLSGRIKQTVGAAANRLLGAVTSAVASWIGPKLKPGALLAISRRAVGERSALMHSAGFLTPADVLFYQRRGAVVRETIRGELAGLPRPVVAIGHSLGGIALVDTLFGPDAKPPEELGVDYLITFGSQSAMLAAIEAIDPVSPTIPWLNIWTLYDFVSFRAGRIWPGATDVEVPIELGFPDSHGAYYSTPGFYAAIRTALGSNSTVSSILD